MGDSRPEDTVRVGSLTGNYAIDTARANRAVGYERTPAGLTWHHVEDGITMQLVPKDLHQAVRHTGGAVILRDKGASLQRNTAEASPMPVLMAAPPTQPTQEDLRLLEEELGARLPDDYRAFLIKFNGGRPEPNWFPMQGELGVGGVDLFLGIRRPGEWDDLLTAKRRLLERMPPHMLPIAHAECGNLICLSLGGSDSGSVYYWDHELEADEGEEPTYANLSHVADSFATFWEAIRTGDPPGV
jgi:hypothetical protein